MPDKKIKVLQLCAVDFTLDKFLAPLCFYLQERGLDVTAACTESVFMEPLRKKGLRCVNMPIDRSMNLLSHRHAYLRLSAFLREERFDIVHVHTPIASLIGRLAAWRRHVPIRIYTAHGFYFHDDMPARQRLLHVGLERFGGFFHHYLFTQSDEDRAAAIRLGIARKGCVRTIGNGIDMHRFDPERLGDACRLRIRESLGIAPDAPVLGIIARMVREKGFFELFRAFKTLAERLPELRLLVIGGALASDHDDSTRELDSLIDELGIRDRIVFTGQRSDIPELLRAMDVYTLPSYREGMPRSVIEAMAMGLPTVATDIRGCREEVIDGKTGFIVPPRTIDPLMERCLDLLSHPDRAREMGRAARERALDLCDEQKVMERQLEVYKGLAREKLGRTIQ
jgi:glycosyltransferase involved in cell wall biosynthesis